MSAAVNSDFSDIAAALTDSLAADGQTPMTGGIQAFAGSALMPGYTFTGDTSTGFFSGGPGSGTIGIALEGVQGGTISQAGGLNLTGSITAGNALTFLGALFVNRFNVQSGSTYTVSGTDVFVGFTNITGSTTVTLPSAAASTGRVLVFTTLNGGGDVVVNSASSNINDIVNSATNSILDSHLNLGTGSTAGVFAILVSTGSLWQVVGGF